MSAALITEVVTTVPPYRSAALDCNPRQISFVDNYLQLKVGWKAAEAAGYSGDRFQLAAIASENLTKPNIQAYYLERLRELQVTPDEVLAEVGEVARYDVIANPRGPIRAVDKLKALELAGKYHRLFVDRVETETADPDRIGSAVVQFLREAVEKHRAALATGSSQQSTLAVESGDGPSVSQSVVQVAQGGEPPVIEAEVVQPGD